MNGLPLGIKEIRSQSTFKKHIRAHLNVEKPPKYYSFGSKMENKFLTHLRVGMSAMHMHFKLKKANFLIVTTAKAELTRTQDTIS